MGIILFCPATWVDLILEDGRQRYFKHCQIGKGTYAIFNGIRHQKTASPELYMDRGGGVN